MAVRPPRVGRIARRGAVLSTLAMAGCAYYFPGAYVNEIAENQITPERHRPLVVCRDRDCARANNGMPKTYAFTALTRLFRINADSVVEICDADPYTHTCVARDVLLPAVAGVTRGELRYSEAKLTDLHVRAASQELEATLDYNMTFGGLRARCTPARITLSVQSADQVIMTDRRQSCNLTTVGATSMSSVYNIDYVDLDYALVGGYYATGVAGASYGGGKGYFLMRFKTAPDQEDLPERKVDMVPHHSQPQNLPRGYIQITPAPDTPGKRK